jgi:hypothetical protein
MSKYHLKNNLKVQNFYIKPHLKPQYANNKPCVESALLGENWLSIKSPKAAQIAKFRPIWSHCQPHS